MAACRKEQIRRTLDGRVEKRRGRVGSRRGGGGARSRVGLRGGGGGTRGSRGTHGGGVGTRRGLRGSGHGRHVSARYGNGNGPNVQVNNAKKQQILSVLLTERKTLQHSDAQTEPNSFFVKVFIKATLHDPNMPGRPSNDSHEHCLGLLEVQLPMAAAPSQVLRLVPVYGLDGVLNLFIQDPEQRLVSIRDRSFLERLDGWYEVQVQGTLDHHYVMGLVVPWSLGFMHHSDLPTEMDWVASELNNLPVEMDWVAGEFSELPKEMDGVASELSELPVEMDRVPSEA